MLNVMDENQIYARLFITLYIIRQTFTSNVTQLTTAIMQLIIANFI